MICKFFHLRSGGRQSHAGDGLFSRTMETCKSQVIRHGVRMTETFWLRSSSQQRRALYRAAKEIADSANITIRDVLKQAVGWQPDAHSGYQDNFRAGRISRKKCAQLYRWMRESHLDVALRLDAELSIAPGFANLKQPHIAHHSVGLTGGWSNCSICNPGRKRLVGKQSALIFTADDPFYSLGYGAFR